MGCIYTRKYYSSMSIKNVENDKYLCGSWEQCVSCAEKEILEAIALDKKQTLKRKTDLETLYA